MNKVLASELGFLGINVDSNFDLAWLKTEVADKIREGDITSIYKLINFARHSEDPAIRDYAVKIEHIYQDKVDAYEQFPSKEAEKENEYIEVETVEDLVGTISNAEGDVKVELKEDIDLTSGSVQQIVIPENSNVEVKLDSNLICEKEAFKVSSGGTLTLTGNGRLVSTTSAAKSAIKAEAGSEVTIDGITIDCVTGREDKLDNWAYGIYATNSSVVNFKSGKIQVGGASCISTNNTTGGSTINISGGELLAKNGYAVYMPAQGTVNITGGKVQGINARMGTINISGDAEILPTGINADNCDPLGSNIKTSGSIALGDTITIIAGTYSDPNGTDLNLNIEGTAKVTSNYKSAIGIYSLDTKEAQNVNVNVMRANQISTTDTEYNSVKVYDHDYIANAATEAGKQYSPVANSNISVKVENEVVYPVSA